MKKDITKLLNKYLKLLLLVEKREKEIRKLKADKLVTDFTIKMMTEVIEEKDKEIKRLELLLKKNYITQ